MKKNYKLAIVGATGLVGRTVLKVLEEKKLPNFEYKLFSSKKSAGSKIKFLGKDYTAHELKENSFDERCMADFARMNVGDVISTYDGYDMDGYEGIIVIRIE